MGHKITILLADDHAVLRAGLRALLSAEPDMEVIGEAGDGIEAVARARELKPNIVVMGIAMPKLNGLAATRQIAQAGLPSKVVVLTMHSEEQYLFQVLEAGAAGYVLKRSADTELMEAIRSTHRGEAFLNPAAARLLVDRYIQQTRSDDTGDAFDDLSERERAVLKLTAEGFSNQEIADKLYISPKTVDTYRSRIMEKLGLHHRSELVRYALRKGLLRPQ